MARKTEEKKRLVKLLLMPDEHDRVRLAAALQRTSISEFVRSVVLAETERLTSSINLPPGTNPKKV